jgi:hypothetical protein
MVTMAKRKRKTVAESRAAASAAARTDVIAEACQVLKWHLQNPKLADELWAAFQSGAELKRGPFYDYPKYQRDVAFN